MSNTNTGGPAFPQQAGVAADGSTFFEGMHLRDYFAAKAMQGLMDAAMPMPEIAAEAYAMADAMLRAREAALKAREA
jgi:hypothetical protein